MAILATRNFGHALVVENQIADTELFPRAELWRKFAASDEAWVVQAARKLVHNSTAFHGIFDTVTPATLERAMRFLLSLANDSQMPALRDQLFETPTGTALLWMGAGEELRSGIARQVAGMLDPVSGPSGPSSFSESIAGLRAHALAVAEQTDITQNVPEPSSARAHTRKAL